MNNEHAIKSMASNFYRSLYKAKLTTTPDPRSWAFPHLERTNTHSLHIYVLASEIRSIVSTMRGLKEAGLDGILPLFYKKY